VCIAALIRWQSNNSDVACSGTKIMVLFDFTVHRNIGGVQYIAEQTATFAKV